MNRYCPNCKRLVPDSELVKNVFHTCSYRTLPRWSEERRRRLRAEERIKELEAENKALRRPLEAANFNVDGMLAIGNELIERDKRIEELEAEIVKLKTQMLPNEYEQLTIEAMDESKNLKG